ncbi:DUF5680 domain-containing protein [Halosolutus gelatinilyticus]|uniref:DUF5680 domain-containing protein n=1 Tax=Halosolutus gelatinilyticus TaxID=2931975 RepID=UPI001FF329B4|nr:DUF5680 domain-containing protein [Halosolutus gelatinilyticus]
MHDLSDFVAKAHRNGYATAQPDADEEQQGTVITYDRDDWTYRDHYYGSEAFLGSEIVIFDGRPVWGMSYYGDLISKNADRTTVYSFLRDALKQATSDRPYRGPPLFESAELTYRSSVTGDMHRFEGNELVGDEESTIYRGTFVGGRVG